ncbi:MAG: hypothetical protein HYY04_13940 [Chloroflexi bacterium]|nr:hypothetical protein [Chloroflexota bacterium]
MSNRRFWRPQIGNRKSAICNLFRSSPVLALALWVALVLPVWCHHGASSLFFEVEPHAGHAHFHGDGHSSGVVAQGAIAAHDLACALGSGRGASIVPHTLQSCVILLVAIGFPLLSRVKRRQVDWLVWPEFVAATPDPPPRFLQLGPAAAGRT